MLGYTTRILVYYDNLQDIPAVYNDTLYYTIQLTPPIVAKAVRLVPETYKKAPCIRFEVLGCDPKGLLTSFVIKWIYMYIFICIVSVTFFST